MDEREETNAKLLDVLRDLRGAQAWADGFASADVVQRMTRQYGLDVSVMLVGRRLSKLADEGRCEKRPGGGAWQYRALDG